MPLVSEWDNAEQTVYRIEVSGKWDWNALTSDVLDVYQEIGRIEHDVDFILAFLSPLPAGDALHHLMYIGGKQPANLKRTVFVNGAGGLLVALVDTIARSKGFDGPKFVRSVDEARLYLLEPADW
ncbi:MAG: hypothetical protein AAF787_22655 [Chloroflexota bacterium]